MPLPAPPKRLVFLISAALVGCVGPPVPVGSSGPLPVKPRPVHVRDGGVAQPDAGASDAGVIEPVPDAGETTVDAGVDAGEPALDGGGEDLDGGDDATDAGSAPDAGTDDGGTSPQECQPALQLTTTSAFALPYDLRVFTATGGTGAYRFALAHDGSGALVNTLTGVYLSGPVAGTEDQVEVTDLGCVGTAHATEQVVPRPVVTPATAEVGPGTSFQIEVEGGSQRLTYVLAATSAGSTLTSGGFYRAGPSAGFDTVVVTDTGTGTSATLTFSVVVGAKVVANPAVLAVPLGARFSPGAIGGSGVFDFLFQGSAFRVDRQFLTAVAPAKVAMTATDHFTGLSTNLKLQAAAPLDTPTVRAGDQSGVAFVLAPGDLDGDGRPDALLGVPEADIGGVDSGAVYLYRSASGGLLPSPARILSRAKREDFGRSIAAADFNKDGFIDVFVGATLADGAAADSGVSLLYKGIAGGLAAEPSLVLSGANGSDRAGFGLVACDFNGDGWMDLAVGAPFAEDLAATPRTNDQGSLSIYLGSDEGFLTRADQVVFGVQPDANGNLVGVTSMNLGSMLAAGDVNGDGRCDLVAAARGTLLATGKANDGLVAVYAGRGPGTNDIGGITTTPVRLMASLVLTDAASALGTSLAVGDLDGDGFDDIAVGQPFHDLSTTATDAGAVRVFKGGTFAAAPVVLESATVTAAWSYEGLAGDRAGMSVAIKEATGDGVADLVVGASRGEVVGGVANVGAVLVFPGTGSRTAPQFPAAAPARTVAGVAAEDQFGAFLAVLGDVDHGGVPDLFTHAPFTDSLGLDVGRPSYIPGETDRVTTPLEMPGNPSASRAGSAVAVVGDVDGDGFDDIVAGAMNSDVLLATGVALNAGAAWLYRGTADGFETTSSRPLTGFTLVSGASPHSGGDQLGQAASGIGDFDGDGAPDFAVVARLEDRPSTFLPAVDYASACPAGARNDSGAVYVFRGRAGALPDARPAFVFYGPDTSGAIDAVSGAGDFDGDGKADLVVGSGGFKSPGATAAITTGGIVLIRGRAADPQGRLTVICDPKTNDLSADTIEIVGSNANDAFGKALASLGDVDGDGCADIAIGATNEDFNAKNDQGSTRVLFGWGGPGCAAEPRLATFAPGIAGLLSGASVAGGADVDGDHIPDLAVGATNLVFGPNTVGAAWLVRGNWIRQAPTMPLAVLVDAVSGQSWWKPPVPALPTLYTSTADAEGLLLRGVVNGEKLGQALALVPSLTGDRRASIAVGSPFGSFAGATQSGLVRVYGYDPSTQALETRPWAIFGGETSRAAGGFGTFVAAGMRANTPVLLVGAPEGSGRSVDDGAAYAADLQR